MTDCGPWVTLGIGAITLVGTAIKLTWWLGDKLDKITTDFTKLVNDHEVKDEDRHRDVVQRLTRVETIVLNGSGERRRSHIV